MDSKGMSFDGIDPLTQLSELPLRVAELEKQRQWLAEQCAKACRFSDGHCAFGVNMHVSKNCDKRACYTRAQEWIEAAEKATRE